MGPCSCLPHLGSWGRLLSRAGRPRRGCWQGQLEGKPGAWEGLGEAGDAWQLRRPSITPMLSRFPWSSIWAPPSSAAQHRALPTALARVWGARSRAPAFPPPASEPCQIPPVTPSHRPAPHSPSPAWAVPWPPREHPPGCVTALLLASTWCPAAARCLPGSQGTGQGKLAAPQS